MVSDGDGTGGHHDKAKKLHVDAPPFKSGYFNYSTFYISFAILYDNIAKIPEKKPPQRQKGENA
mgnify:CR=1 FL=1